MTYIHAGPFEIPFLGQIPVVDEKQADPLRRKYGDVVSWV